MSAFSEDSYDLESPGSLLLYQHSKVEQLIFKIVHFYGALGINDLLPGLLGLYKEIRSPIFFVRPKLAASSFFK